MIPEDKSDSTATTIGVGTMRPASEESAQPLVPLEADAPWSQPFCPHCGSRLVLRNQAEDGMEPWCPTCGTWRYPSFSVACSMIVLDPTASQVLTIDQYHKQGILVAGYVLRGQDLQETIRREVMEEVGLEVADIVYNASSFYERSNTLMVNFACRATSGEVHTDHEVDSWHWVPREEAVDHMKPGSLAQDFVRTYLEKLPRA